MKNIIKIQPLIPNYLTIDTDNNMHIKYNNNFKNIIDLINKDINIVDVYDYKVPIQELKFKKTNIYIL